MNIPGLILPYPSNRIHAGGRTYLVPIKDIGNVQVNEIVYIYDDPGQEEDLRGTIMLMALGNNKAGTGANFVAKGTGDFEGLIIQGVSDPLYTVDNPAYVDETTTPGVPPVFYVLDRIGTAMG